jgi:hypothetical protein
VSAELGVVCMQKKTRAKRSNAQKTVFLPHSRIKYEQTIYSQRNPRFFTGSNGKKKLLV